MFRWYLTLHLEVSHILQKHDICQSDCFQLSDNIQVVKAEQIRLQETKISPQIAYKRIKWKYILTLRIKLLHALNRISKNVYSTS